jgi:hypothetical protein
MKGCFVPDYKAGANSSLTTHKAVGEYTRAITVALANLTDFELIET